MEKLFLNRKGKPPGCKSHPELYLLLNMNFKPADIVKMGFSKGMVYRYNKKFLDAKEQLKKLLMKAPPGERGGLEPD